MREKLSSYPMRLNAQISIPSYAHLRYSNMNFPKKKFYQSNFNHYFLYIVFQLKIEILIKTQY